MRISVLVPTYRRPPDLERCLQALARQTRPADEIVVVGRREDADTWAVLENGCWRGLPLKLVAVDTPGVVQAMNAGLQAAGGEVLAITDDDAAPRPDWLERIEAHFDSDPRIAGVGGRDWLHPRDRFQDGARPVVGRLQWFGRVIGNHHLGVGGPREVDVLKGVCCAYRAELLRQPGFDTRLRGSGAQVDWELSLGLSLRRTGWKLIYDPAVAVDHYPAERHDEDVRDGFNSTALANATHNGTLVLLEHLTPARRIVFLLWLWCIGTRASPGLVLWLLLWPVERGLANAKWRAAARGRLDGWRTWRRHGHSAALDHSLAAR